MNRNTFKEPDPPQRETLKRGRQLNRKTLKEAELVSSRVSAILSTLTVSSLDQKRQRFKETDLQFKER